MNIRIKLLSPLAITPVQREGDAGADLYAIHDVDVLPGCVAKVDFGIAIELPPGHCAYVMPRSGLASKGALAVTGLVDESYRGSIGATLHNTTRETWRVKRGDRVAQMVVHPCPRVLYDVTSEDLTGTDRGAKGFGSTGVSLRDELPRTVCKPAAGYDANGSEV